MKTKKTLTSFQQKALVYDKHIVLTANAGSGKTFVFAKRFVNIALKENPELDKIIAITFTEKAAGELYTSIVKEVAEKRKEFADDTTKLAKLNKIRKHLVSANISTIHSFCIDILHDFSPEAGIDANFSPLDPTIASYYREKSFDELYSAHLKSDSQILKFLVRHFGSKLMLWRALESTFGKRQILQKIKSEFYDNGHYSLNKLNKRFDELFQLILPPIIKRFVESLIVVVKARLDEKPNNKVALEALALLQKATDFSDSFEMLQFIGNPNFTGLLFTKSNTFKKKFYPKEDDYNQQISVIDSFAKFLFNAPNNDKHFANKELSKFADIFLTFFDELESHYSAKKYENGYLDFDDILLLTQKLVRDKTVLEKLREKYRFIMIDEFQDTNELQYEIFIPILDELKAGNLFVVGDEKQSIYRFNSAELEVFRNTGKEVLKNRGEKLELPHSFRLAPNLALFTNTIFRKLFANPDPIYNEVEFNELASAREISENGKIEFLLTDAEKDSCSEAEVIAKKILQLTTNNKDLSYGDFAILFRRNNDITEVEKTLVKFNIPYSVVGGRGFFQQLVVGDIHNYFSFLLSQNNDAALLGILRSPFYSFPDPLIFSINNGRGNTFWEKVKNYSANSKFVAAAVKLIEKHIVISVPSDVSNLLTTILDDTAYWSVIASKPNAKQEIANTKKLIRFSVEAINSETTSLYDFTQKLGTAIRETTDEGFAQLAEESKSVKLLTIHKSKGLEFDTVFIYKTNSKLKSNSQASKGITIDKEFGIITKVPQKGSYFNKYELPAHGWLFDYYDKRKELAEAKRLLYVAVTRAVNSLYITGTRGTKSTVSENSFLQMFQKSLGIDFNSKGFELSGKLPVINLEENSISYEKLQCEIKITNEVLYEQSIENKATEHFEVKLLNKKINDTESHEIVSATKITLFKECPTKYNLTYNLGLGELNSLLKNEDYPLFDKEREPDETLNLRVPSNKVGMLLHKLLEQETGSNNFEENYKLASSTIFEKEEFEKFAESLKKEVKQILDGYFSSAIYKWISSQTDFRNEFEIYHKVEDYYLYGIIDKIIFDKEQKKVSIVDYKSDNIKENEISGKFEHYLTQLKLYSFLASTIFTWAKSFEVRLIFLKSPSIDLRKNITLDEINLFAKEVDSIVQNIRFQNFPKNKDACKHCHFAKKNLCIVPD